MGKIQQLKKAIDESKRICVFTGAGISCPSGIPDFRSATGVYSSPIGKYRADEMISRTFFNEHPELFFPFYREKLVHPEAKPNAAHYFFADLEKRGKEVSIVTQNVDGLHQAAGSREVYELHGSVHRNYCTKCGRIYDLATILLTDGIPRCPHDDGIIKPDVVLYEESLDSNVVDDALFAIESADLMIVVGTSLVVYPAAAYVSHFRGNTLALVNRTPTQYDAHADIAIHADIIDVVNAL